MADWMPAHTGSHMAASDGMLGPETADCVHQQTCFKQALPVNRAGCPWRLPVAFRQRLGPAGRSLTQAPLRVLLRAAPGPGQVGAAVWGLVSCSQRSRRPFPISLKLLGPGEGAAMCGDPVPLTVCPGSLLTVPPRKGSHGEVGRKSWLTNEGSGTNT